jgi:uncharacterized ferritin-like protein (DUF455 family)
MELRQRALDAFSLDNPDEKVAAVLAIWRDAATAPLDTEAYFEGPLLPGRPALPALVQPQEVPRRSPFTPQGHAALVHSITHIEFNAINLALDAVWRFTGMPAAFYQDWLRVAFEEANHFSYLRQHLREQGFDYGDFSAHDGLWTMCAATRHDVAARMALVPRTLEARGLDATPIIQEKLRKVGTPAAIAANSILDLILREEVGHVAIGNHWYRWLCARNGHDPIAYYQVVSEQLGGPKLKPPFNIAARRLAGFTDAEINALPQSA